MNPEIVFSVCHRHVFTHILLENVGWVALNRTGHLEQMFKVTTSGLPACMQPPTFSRRRHMLVAYWKDNFRVERVQHRFTRILPGLKSLEYDDQLKVLGIWSLEERRNRADLLEVFKMKSGLSAVTFDTFFTVDSQQRTRSHTLKIVKNQSNLDVRKYFFSERAADRWNKLEQSDIGCGSINGFRNKLEIWKTSSAKPHGLIESRNHWSWCGHTR